MTKGPEFSMAAKAMFGLGSLLIAGGASEQSVAPQQMPANVETVVIHDVHAWSAGEAVGFILAQCEVELPGLLDCPANDASEDSLITAMQSDETAPAPEIVVPSTTTTVPPPPPTPTATAVEASPQPAPETTTPTPGEPADAVFDKLAGCESGGNWNTSTGNGYYGGLQFSAGTWRALGGTALPSQNPRETQIAIARKQWRMSGWKAWPSCRRQLRLG